MPKLISPKLIFLALGILFSLFLAVFYAFAGGGTAQSPPLANVPAPLNVSDTNQTNANNSTYYIKPLAPVSALFSLWEKVDCDEVARQMKGKRLLQIPMSPAK